MAGKTLDAIVTDFFGIKEMTIARLMAQLEEAKATVVERDETIASLQATLTAASAQKESKAP